jgi:hypothetical protein
MKEHYHSHPFLLAVLFLSTFFAGSLMGQTHVLPAGGDSKPVDSQVAATTDLPDAPSITLQETKKTDDAKKSDAQAGSQKTQAGKTNHKDEVHGPYQGHFFYLIPAYHVVELSQPFRPIGPHEKFHIFLRDTFDQSSLVLSLFNAGLDEATGSYKGYGGGPQGFGKRLGAEAAGVFTGNFMTDFFVPTITREDPRYFRKGSGSGSSRFWYAVSRVAVTRTDHGHNTLNISEFAGTMASAEFAQLYLPKGDRNTKTLAIGAFLSIAEDAGINILKEFGPEWHKKFRVKVPRETPGSEK